MQKFEVIDKPGGEYRLRCTDEANGPLEMGLWLVAVVVPGGTTSTVHVLAATEKMARNMAELAAGVASYEVSKHLYEQVKTSCLRLPLIVQGWGKAQM